MQKLLEAVGGSITFAGEVSRLTLGEVEELWDEVAIACYPTRGAMLEMMQLPEMAEIARHRAAGLAGQLSIECLGDPALGLEQFEAKARGWGVRWASGRVQIRSMRVTGRPRTPR